MTKRSDTIETLEVIMAREVLARYLRDTRMVTNPGDKLDMDVFRACYAHVAHRHNISFHYKKRVLSNADWEERKQYNLFFGLTRGLVSAKLKQAKPQPAEEKSQQSPRRALTPVQLPLFGPPEEFLQWRRQFDQKIAQRR
ncbi:MAG: hypothetical protein WA082_03245 [Candidatus Moraniibacteriota bacterium]